MPGRIQRILRRPSAIDHVAAFEAERNLEQVLLAWSGVATTCFVYGASVEIGVTAGWKSTVDAWTNIGSLESLPKCCTWPSFLDVLESAHSTGPSADIGSEWRDGCRREGSADGCLPFVRALRARIPLASIRFCFPAGFRRDALALSARGHTRIQLLPLCARPLSCDHRYTTYAALADAAQIDGPVRASCRSEPELGSVVERRSNTIRLRLATVQREWCGPGPRNPSSTGLKSPWMCQSPFMALLLSSQE